MDKAKNEPSIVQVEFLPFTTNTMLIEKNPVAKNLTSKCFLRLFVSGFNGRQMNIT